MSAMMASHHDADEASAPAHAAPMARGLIDWPSAPPRFDAIMRDELVLAVPLVMNDASDTPAAKRGTVRAGECLLREPVRGQYAALSPVDGETRAPRMAALFDGRRVPAVEVQARSSHSPRGEALRETPADLSAWIDRLAGCGVGAWRHESPDLIDQLNQALRRPVDTILCTTMDVDPSACVQSAWAAQNAEDLVAGVALIARLCNVARPMIVIDERTPSRWWSSLRGTLRAERSIRLVELENDYPQADPTLLLYTLTNRRLRPGRSPSALGAIVLDGAAASAVGACVRRNEAMLHVPLVVRDHNHSESYFVTAPIGLRAGQLLEILGVPRERDAALIVRGGDVLRDRRVPIDEAVVSASELLLHLATAPPAVSPDPCIRCAWCFEACPTRIQPANLLDAAQFDDQELAERAGLAACIECGICTYVCPSHLPLLDGIRDLRARRSEEHP